MTGYDLFKYCINTKYKSDREYVQILMTLSSQLEEEEFFTLLERAEKLNKKLVIKDNPDQLINDQYIKEDVFIE